MIEISTNTALMLYLGVTLIILMGVWSTQHFRRRHQKIVKDEQELLICEFCHFAYLEDIAKPVTKCPQCQSFNKGNNYKAST